MNTLKIYRFSQNLLRILAWIMTIVLILLIIAQVIFEINKTNIKDYIVSTINGMQTASIDLVKDNNAGLLIQCLLQCRDYLIDWSAFTVD